MLSRRSDPRRTDSPVRQLTVRLLDEWERIRYYHQLIEIDTEENPEIRDLFVDCYLDVSQKHWQEMEVTLNALWKEIFTEERET